MTLILQKKTSAWTLSTILTLLVFASWFIFPELNESKIAKTASTKTRLWYWPNSIQSSFSQWINEASWLQDTLPLLIPTTTPTTPVLPLDIHKNPATPSLTFNPYLIGMHAQRDSITGEWMMPETPPNLLSSWQFNPITPNNPTKNLISGQISNITQGNISEHFIQMNAPINQKLWTPTTYWIHMHGGTPIGHPVKTNFSGIDEIDHALDQIAIPQTLTYLNTQTSNSILSPNECNYFKVEYYP